MTRPLVRFAGNKFFKTLLIVMVLSNLSACRIIENTIMPLDKNFNDRQTFTLEDSSFSSQGPNFQYFDERFEQEIGEFHIANVDVEGKRINSRRDYDFGIAPIGFLFLDESFLREEWKNTFSERYRFSFDVMHNQKRLNRAQCSAQVTGSATESEEIFSSKTESEGETKEFFEIECILGFEGKTATLQIAEESYKSVQVFILSEHNLSMTPSYQKEYQYSSGESQTLIDRGVSGFVTTQLGKPVSALSVLSDKKLTLSTSHAPEQQAEQIALNYSVYMFKRLEPEWLKTSSNSLK